MENVKLLIGTPAYGNMLHIDCHNTILNLYMSNTINFDSMMVGNESLVPRARNKIISYFYYEGSYTHLLFLDADMGMSPSDIVKLINREKNVIGVPVSLKGFDSYGNPVLNTGKILGQEEDLVISDRIGTAIFMLSKKAVSDLINTSKSYKSNPIYTRGDKVYNDIHDVFGIGIYDGEYLSEDYYVCKSLMKLGYQVYIDPTIPNVHNGNYPFVFRGKQN